MAENPNVLGPEQQTDRTGTEPRMFSLMEVAQETGIAMPLLLRYKREHPDRIPSTGSGAQQRFPEEAFAIFEELHSSESQTRDRPRRGGFGLLSLPRVRRTREKPESSAATPPEAPASSALAAAAPQSAPAGAEEGRGGAPNAGESANDRGSTSFPASPQASTPPSLAAPTSTSEATLTMKDIAETLGIAYPTIARYVSKHGERIPYEGEGRQRRFPPEALEVFRQIRKESKPGRPPKSGSRRSRERSTHAAAPSEAPARTGGPAPTDAQLLRRIERLERHQQQLETMVRSLRDEIDRPLTAIVEPA